MTLKNTKFHKDRLQTVTVGGQTDSSRGTKGSLVLPTDPRINLRLIYSKLKPETIKIVVVVFILPRISVYMKSFKV